ncbi:FMN-binding protein [Bifidobacterium aquikefiri]|uniref:FMN-binding protein n=1 Tax=Bifidobacterium aquikefiri TaxID=1653207 RepID=UPI0023F42C35|nr:FMN-binding protein [Bifidobacterium aquikefiri]
MKSKNSTDVVINAAAVPRRVRHAALAAVGVVAASVVFSACGQPKAVPMDDEYAGGGEESSSAPTDSSGSSGSSSASSTASASPSSTKTDSGTYKDGTYSVKSTYGPVGEDSIDVHVKVTAGKVSDIEVVGHSSNSISQKHQQAFIKAVPGVVDGKALKTLKVDKVAGASWTSDAFNKAIEVAREQASE